METSINQSSMLRVGTILHDTYRIEGYLASGGFGNTYVAFNIQFGERCAIKEFFLKGMTQRVDSTSGVSVSNADNISTFMAQKEKFKKEAVRLRKLSSPNIVRVHDLFEANGTAYYVMDFIDGESLRDQLKRLGHPLDEEAVWKILNQVLDALKVVHDQGLFHLDLKPANLMVDKKGEVILIDFGASKQISAESGVTTSTAVSYTNGYAPREQMEQNLDKFGPWTDFYALGATIYTLLTANKPPLPTDIDDDMSEDKHLTLPMPNVVSEKMRQLVLWLMATNRRERPQTVEDIRLFVEHTDVKRIPEREEGENQHEETIIDEECNHSQARSSESIRPRPEDSEPSNIQDKVQSTEKKKTILKPLLCFLAFFFIGGILAWMFLENNSDNPEKSSVEIADTIKNATGSSSPKTVKEKAFQHALGSCTYSGEVDAQLIPNGKGEAWFNDGRYYKGLFVHGNFDDPHAFFRYQNGDTFVGVMEGNRFQSGKYTIEKDGSYFMGTFDAYGQPEKGKWYDKAGNEINPKGK